MSEDPTGRTTVAVGPSRDAATRAFGPLFDDLFVTTYDDLSAEVDLADTGTLALADGPGAGQLLAEVLDSDGGPQLVLEVPGDTDRRGWLADALQAHPEVGVVSASHGEGGRTAIVLGAAGPEAVSGPAVATLLAALPPVATAASVWPEPMAEVPAEAGLPDPVPARLNPPALPGPRRGLVARLGRRGLLMLCGVAVLGVVAAVVLVLIGRSDLGADGVLVTITLATAAVQVLIVAAVAYLVRNVRRAHHDTVEFRERMSRRTERLVNQGLAARKRSVLQGKRLVNLRKAAEREQKHHEYVVELGRQLNRHIRDRGNENQRLHLVSQRQTQALLNLHDLVRVEAAVPPAGGWAASPDLILYCVDTLLAERPALVVECGSGLSTLFLSLAAKQHGLDTRIVALEHEERFAASTRALLERHGVADRAEVRLAPLEPTSLPGHETPWYAESALTGLDGIGVLLIDGPPTATGPQARFPAVPLLRDGFAPRCTIVMDDLIRESDHETADSWSAMLPDFDYSVIREFEKHVGILRRR